MEKTRILITNDDGYHSEGIIALEQALSDLGDVFVVAPESEQSGASHSLTLGRPLRIRQIDGRHWTVDGTPTDCVTLALNQILKADERPHICVSGINHGPNLGDDATYSGTVAGALESTILGVPGLAFSLAASRSHDFSQSMNFARQITERAISPFSATVDGLFMTLILLTLSACFLLNAFWEARDKGLIGKKAAPAKAPTAKAS